jgi:hypothetical protein
MFRRGPAIVLSLWLGAAALVVAPSATAGDGGTAKDNDKCPDAGRVKLKVEPYGDGRLEVTGIMVSDDNDLWDWKFKHNGDVSADGQARADGDGEGRAFKVVRTMVNLSGDDNISFRATNDRIDVSCKAELKYTPDQPARPLS